jgi:hypothetical protein
MDENVLAAALRLNEPITFGRIELLHDTGRHGSLHFGIWTITAHQTESKMSPAARNHGWVAR